MVFPLETSRGDDEVCARRCLYQENEWSGSVDNVHAERALSQRHGENTKT